MVPSTVEMLFFSKKLEWCLNRSMEPKVRKIALSLEQMILSNNVTIKAENVFLKWRNTKAITHSPYVIVHLIGPLIVPHF